jgi:hypothetical protein
MAELKTRKTEKSVEAFLRGISDPKRRTDCEAVAAIMKKATGEKPKMWGPAIVGFGDLRYVTESGREGDWFVTGFSPRKDNLTLYIMPGIQKFATLLKTLGKHKTGKSCLYIKTLEDVDQAVLRKIVESSVALVKKLPATSGM